MHVVQQTRKILHGEFRREPVGNLNGHAYDIHYKKALVRLNEEDLLRLWNDSEVNWKALEESILAMASSAPRCAISGNRARLS